MIRSATAHWSGGYKDGSGTLTAPGGVLSATPYSFATRFGDTPGTNPEELIAAAHAGCFTMAFTRALGSAGFTPTAIDTTASLTIEPVDSGYSITTVRLRMTASIPGIDESRFQSIAADAKANCPVSKALNAVITLEATLA